MVSVGDVGRGMPGPGGRDASHAAVERLCWPCAVRDRLAGAPAGGRKAPMAGGPGETDLPAAAPMAPAGDLMAAPNGRMGATKAACPRECGPVVAEIRAPRWRRAPTGECPGALLFNVKRNKTLVYRALL